MNLTSKDKLSIPLLPLCEKCGLYKDCNSPKMPVWGEGKKEILILGEAPGCITGDSLIDTAFRDKSKYPNGVPIKELVGQEGIYVYSFDLVRQELTVGRVNKIWKTGRKKVYRVTYEWKYPDKDKVVFLRDSIKVTNNHQFLLKRKIKHDPFLGLKTESNYLSLNDGLKVGHSLQPFLRRSYEYCYIGTSWKSMVREGRYLLGWGLNRRLMSGEDCHHADENKHNDCWNNLELHTTENHARLHIQTKNPMDNPTHRDKHRKAVVKGSYRSDMSKKLRCYLSDPINYEKRLKQIECTNEARSDTVKNLYKDPEYYYHYLIGRKNSPKFNLPEDWVERKFKERFPGESIPVDNHKVVAIEYVGIEDVYDMEVEGHHNFAVNGIFVHNSNEDREGRPFIGRAGQKLREHLERYGVDADKDCWITNSLICHPKDKNGNNRKPSKKEIGFCRPNVVRNITELKPRVIIPLGEVAVNSLLGWLWRPKVGAVSRWVDWAIPDRQLNAWICPNYHPSWVIRQGGETDDVKDLLFRKAIKKAIRLEGRPWNNSQPDYAKQVQIIMDPDEAKMHISIMSHSNPVAFDFETDQLKPDGNGEIICCSMSNGITTIAFPWHGKQVKEAMKKFLESPTPKVGQNVKFESRWVKKEFGCDVNNWVHDCMITAHVLDNKRGITGIEFQAYVLLGQTPWDYDVHEYLKVKGSTKKNKIKECDLRKLLLYCGIDSLIEWQVSQIQMGKLNAKKEAKRRKRTTRHLACCS